MSLIKEIYGKWKLWLKAYSPEIWLIAEMLDAGVLTLVVIFLAWTFVTISIITNILFYSFEKQEY